MIFSCDFYGFLWNQTRTHVWSCLHGFPLCLRSQHVPAHPSTVSLVTSSKKLGMPRPELGAWMGTAALLKGDLDIRADWTSEETYRTTINCIILYTWIWHISWIFLDPARCNSQPVDYWHAAAGRLGVYEWPAQDSRKVGCQPARKSVVICDISRLAPGKLSCGESQEMGQHGQQATHL